MAQNWMAPWLSLWAGGDTTNNFPSGDVRQMFRLLSPEVTISGKGDPELEARIVRDVATYGAQIGQLTEIALALAEGKAPPAEAVTKLKDIAAKVEAVKKEHAETALARARDAVEELKKADPAGYDILLASLKRG